MKKNHEIQSGTKTVRLNPGKIRAAIQVARETFGFFHFTYLPEWIKGGVEEVEGDYLDFFEGHYAVAFFPAMAKMDIAKGAASNLEVKKHLAGLSKVCKMLGCKDADQVVCIVPEDLY